MVKGSHASGWQARGFATNDALKDFALDSNAAAVVRALNDRAGTNAGAGEFDGRFHRTVRNRQPHVRLLPLILKDKVAALIYADGGVEDKALDAGALDVLVLATGSWLEVNFAAQTGPERRRRRRMPTSTNRPPRQSRRRTLFNDPFAAHAPVYAMAAAASSRGNRCNCRSSLRTAVHQAEGQSAAVEVQSAAVAEPEVAAEPLAVGHVQTEVAPAAPPPGPPMSPEDEEIHRKARRFARLLVDEIKLYNKAKLAEGRANKNLYDRVTGSNRQEPRDVPKALREHGCSFRQLL